MKSFWLIKSEPFVYNIDQLNKDKVTSWEGVRNYAARNHLRSMKKGDEILFYHSMEELAVVGIAKVEREAYQDPSTEDDRWSAVDIKFYKKLNKPVSLDQIKKDKRLSQMALVRIGRLSVQPVTEEEYQIILAMAQ